MSDLESIIVYKSLIYVNYWISILLKRSYSSSIRLLSSIISNYFLLNLSLKVLLSIVLDAIIFYKSLIYVDVLVSVESIYRLSSLMYLALDYDIDSSRVIRLSLDLLLF